MQMIRTTVYLEENLLRLAKLEAAKRGGSLTGLVKEGLKKELGVAEKKKKIRFRLKTYSMGGYRFKRADAYE